MLNRCRIQNRSLSANSVLARRHRRYVATLGRGSDNGGSPFDVVSGSGMYGAYCARRCTAKVSGRTRVLVL